MIDTGLPRRIPFGIAPSTRHLVCLEFVTGAGAAIDQTGTTWTCTLNDAHTGAVVKTYSSEVDGNLVQFVLGSTDTAELVATKAYEVRITRTSPGPDALFYGPVIFPPHYVPQAA